MTQHPRKVVAVVEMWTTAPISVLRDPECWNEPIYDSKTGIRHDVEVTEKAKVNVVRPAKPKGAK